MLQTIPLSALLDCTPIATLSLHLSSLRIGERDQSHHTPLPVLNSLLRCRKQNLKSTWLSAKATQVGSSLPWPNSSPTSAYPVLKDHAILVRDAARELSCSPTAEAGTASPTTGTLNKPPLRPVSPSDKGGPSEYPAMLLDHVLVPVIPCTALSICLGTASVGECPVMMHDGHQLAVCSARDGLYVAISHVWADDSGVQLRRGCRPAVSRASRLVSARSFPTERSG